MCDDTEWMVYFNTLISALQSKKALTYYIETNPELAQEINVTEMRQTEFRILICKYAIVRDWSFQTLSDFLMTNTFNLEKILAGKTNLIYLQQRKLETHCRLLGITTKYISAEKYIKYRFGEHALEIADSTLKKMKQIAN